MRENDDLLLQPGILLQNTEIIRHHTGALQPCYQCAPVQQKRRNMDFLKKFYRAITISGTNTKECQKKLNLCARSDVSVHCRRHAARFTEGSRSLAAELYSKLHMSQDKGYAKAHEFHPTSMQELRSQPIFVRQSVLIFRQ